MSKKELGREQHKRLEQERKEIEQALSETIEDTIKKAGPVNALAWVAVTVGAFLLNLGLLVVITGG